VIDADTFNRMKIDLLAEITLTDMELREAAMDVVSATDVVDFALDMLVNTSNRWKAASVDQKQRLQQVLFPEALEYAKGDYRTTATCLLFNGLEIDQTEREEMVALPGIGSSCLKKITWPGRIRLKPQPLQKFQNNPNETSHARSARDEPRN